MLLLLPQSSVAVKVTVAVPVAPQSSLKASKSLLQVTSLHASDAMAPPLLAASVKVSCVARAVHSTVASMAAMSMAGAVVSSIVNVAVVLLLLPQSSVAVKVTVAVPVAPQSSLKASKSLLQVTSLHAVRCHGAAVAGEPSVKVSCVARAVALNHSGHGGHVDGRCRGVFVVNVAVVLLLFAAVVRGREGHGSRAVAPQSSLKASKSLLQVTSLHASDAMAPPLLASHPSRSAALPAPSHSTGVHGGHVDGRCRGVFVVNVAVVLLLLPQSSVAVKVTVAVPVAPQSSLKASKSLLQVTSLRVRCHGAAVAGEPSVKVSCVARAVALNRSVHGGHVDGRCRGVFDQ